MSAAGTKLICYFDSRELWRSRASTLELAPSAIEELAYLLPAEERVVSTFREIASFLEPFEVTAQLVEAGDASSICSIVEEASTNTILFNMTDGFFPVTASYFPGFAAMTGKRYFGNSSAMQLSIQNKFIQYLMCCRLGIPTPRTALYDGERFLAGDDRRNRSQAYFVKPFDLANSIGIFADAFCESLEEAVAVAERIKRHYGSKSLIQEYVQGDSVRVNYVAADRRLPVDQTLGIHLMQGPEEDDEGVFIDFETHLSLFKNADAAYERMAIAISLTDSPTSEGARAAVSGIRHDTRQLVDCFGLRDFFSMDYKIDDNGERHFIELNTLPFARNAGLRAYCKEAFQSTVGGALGAAIHLSLLDPSRSEREW